MILHILNGDAVAYTFGQTAIEGEVIICRECLIEGPVSATDPEQFWQERAQYIADTYHEPAINYGNGVAAQFKQLLNLAPGTEVNLWFEHDLFCQVNMWYILYLLAPQASQLKIYCVYPYITDQQKLWQGFGPSTADDLNKAYQNKQAFTISDVALGNQLWKAYQHQENAELMDLSLTQSPCFPHLAEVCKAQVDRSGNNNEPGRPEKTLQRIIATGTTDFNQLYAEFFKRDGVYGFGDLQVKQLLKKLQ